MKIPLEMRLFLTHTADVGWSSDDQLFVAPDVIRRAESSGWVKTERWKGRYATAELTARGKSIVRWFLRYEGSALATYTASLER